MHRLITLFLIEAIMSPSMPDMPPPPPPPAPPPTVDTARERVRSRDEMARKRGRAATVLTEPTSQVQPQTAAKTLLGG